MQEKLFSIHSWNFASKYFPDIFFVPSTMTDLSNFIWLCGLSPISTTPCWVGLKEGFLFSLTHWIHYNEKYSRWTRKWKSESKGERDRDTRREKERQRNRRRQKERLTGLFRPRPSGDIGRRLTPAPGFHNYCIHYRELPSFLFHFPLQKFNFSPLIAHIISRVQITLKTFG